MSKVGMQELGEEIERALAVKDGGAGRPGKVPEYLAGWLSATYALYPLRDVDWNRVHWKCEQGDAVAVTELQRELLKQLQRTNPTLRRAVERDAIVFHLVKGLHAVACEALGPYGDWSKDEHGRATVKPLPTPGCNALCATPGCGGIALYRHLYCAECCTPEAIDARMKTTTEEFKRRLDPVREQFGERPALHPFQDNAGWIPASSPPKIGQAVYTWQRPHTQGADLWNGATWLRGGDKVSHWHPLFEPPDGEMSVYCTFDTTGDPAASPGGSENIDAAIAHVHAVRQAMKAEGVVCEHGMPWHAVCPDCLTAGSLSPAGKSALTVEEIARFHGVPIEYLTDEGRRRLRKKVKRANRKPLRQIRDSVDDLREDIGLVNGELKAVAELLIEIRDDQRRWASGRTA
jgi:hypothetical protein